MLKYESIAMALRQHIEDAALQAGDKLPSIANLKTQFQVSKSTLLKALTLLEKEGTIHQAHGSGIYVRNKKRPNYINLFTSNGFSDDLKDHTISSKVITCDLRIPDTHIQTHLQLAHDEPVYYVERLRYIDGAVLCIEASYFNPKIVTHIDASIAEGSIFHYIENELNVNIGYSDIYFNVDTLQTDEAVQLACPTGAPTLRYEQLFYTNTGTPFDYAQITFNYQHAHFYIPSIK